MLGGTALRPASAGPTSASTLLRGGRVPTLLAGLFPCGHRGCDGTSRFIPPAPGLQPKTIKSIVCTFNKIKCTKVEPVGTTSVFKLHSNDMLAARNPHGAHAFLRTDSAPESHCANSGSDPAMSGVRAAGGCLSFHTSSWAVCSGVNCHWVACD